MLRFASKPIADMSIDDLRVALFNFIVAKQKNEELLVRIDDMEKDKNIEGKEKEIIEILNLFGIEHSRTIIQSENIKYHTGMGMNLLLDKKAFNCFCSDEALQEDKKKAKKEGKPYSYSGFCETISDETKFNCNAPFVVRLKKPEENIVFNDLLNGKYELKPFEIDSLVILGFDKTPSSNFASAVDDMLYDISTVIAKDEDDLNTAKQIHIRKAMGYDKEIEYAHISSITNNIAVKELIDEGFLPAAIANYLVLLGYETPKEIFTIEEAIEWFDIKKLSMEPLEFDMEKLKAINIEYLKMLDNMRLSKLLGFADEDIGVLAKHYLDELSTIKELKSKIDKIFAPRSELTNYPDEYKVLRDILKDMPFIDSFEEFEKRLKEKSELVGDKFAMPLRYILTGSLDGIELSKIYPCIKNYLGEII